MSYDNKSHPLEPQSDVAKLEELQREIASLKVERKLQWNVTHELENRLKKIEDANGVTVHNHIDYRLIEDEVRKAIYKVQTLHPALADTSLLGDVAEMTH